MSVWKPIPAFPDYYASVTGEVLSLKKLTPSIMKQTLDSKGYKVVNIDGKVRRVHRLVASAFLNLDFGDTKQVIMHLDDNPQNNNLANLMLGTQLENLADMRGKLRHTYGEKTINAKLTERDVRNIKLRLANGETGASLAKEYRVTVGNISNIKQGIRWKHVK